MLMKELVEHFIIYASSSLGRFPILFLPNLDNKCNKTKTQTQPSGVRLTIIEILYSRTQCSVGN
jgi:hypothetical protein